MGEVRAPEIGPVRSLILVLFTFFTLTLVQVTVPLRLDQLHVGAVIIGCLLALPSLTGLLTEAPFAAMSDSVGRRSVIALGALLLIASSLILATTVSPWFFAFALLLYGAGLGAQTSSLMAALSESVPPKYSAHVQGWNGAAQRVGALGIAALLAITSQPTTILWFVGVAGLVCLAVAAAVPHWRLLGRQRTSLLRTSITALSMLRRSRFVQVGAMNNIMLSMLFISTNSFVGLILRVSESPLPLASLILSRDLVSIVLALAFGPIAARIGWQTCFLLGMCTGTASMLIGVLTSSDSPWMYVLFALSGVGIGLGIAGANLAVTYGTSNSERAIGMVSAGYAGRLTSLLAPIALAFAFSRAAGLGVFVIALAVTAAATLRATWLLYREPRKGQIRKATNPSLVDP